MTVKHISFEENKLILLDQRYLPNKIEYVVCKNEVQTAEAIRDMIVRGAPAIGVAAAYGVVLGAISRNTNSKKSFIKDMDFVFETLSLSRPTAVNLFWAIERMRKLFYSIVNLDINEIIPRLKTEADNIFFEDIELNKKIGEYGANLLPDKCTILTHCNAGALATAGWGTALGVIRSAREMGKQVKIFADETRPYLQGARLTAFELLEDGFDVTLISDNMAGHVMKLGLIDAVIVGADRIAGNGDTANKIGTYSLSILSKIHNIPFYIAAPYSTFDLCIESGNDIPIEERNPDEVTSIFGVPVAPKNVKVFNPSFDVTPNENITAIITDKGVLTKPFKENIKNIL